MSIAFKTVLVVGWEVDSFPESFDSSDEEIEINGEVEDEESENKKIKRNVEIPPRLQLVSYRSACFGNSSDTRHFVAFSIRKKYTINQLNALKPTDTEKEFVLLLEPYHPKMSVYSVLSIE